MSGKLFERSTLIVGFSGVFCLLSPYLFYYRWPGLDLATWPHLVTSLTALFLYLLLAMQLNYRVNDNSTPITSLDNYNVNRDAKERITREENFYNGELQLHGQYLNAPIGLITIDWKEDLIVLANTRLLEILGYHRDTQPRSASSLWANPNDFNQLIQTLQDKHSVYCSSCEMISRDGNVINVELFASMLDQSNYIEASIIDISEKMQVLNLTQTQFLANMNHEIRTPMIGILGSVSLLEQSDLSREQLDSVAVIRECGEHLLTIINEILDVSRIDLGSESLSYQASNLVDIFNQTVYLIESSAKEKGLSVSLDLQEPIGPIVLTDPIKLRQILLNLLYNALKFTNHGVIHINARLENQGTPGECLFAMISDTGIGIDQEKMQSIFEPFTQGDSSSSRIFGGTGLGLYVCRKLVELLEGTIWVESQEDQGTIFFIRIPVQTVADTGLGEMQQEETRKLSSIPDFALTFNPVQVLLVEDNRINHRIVSQMLSSYGFEVSTAEHGLDCLRIMQGRHFDVVLMDMQMPVMDGYEAARYISSDPDLRKTPVIAMTAHSMAGDREKCLYNGCSDYIAKPFRIEDLIKVINRNLHSAKTTDPVSDDRYDQLLAELLPEFIDSLTEMIQDLYTAVDRRDTKAVQSSSHDIKGTAGMYGFQQISDLAALIEQAAQDNKLLKVQSLSATLYSIYEQLYQQVS